MQGTDEEEKTPKHSRMERERNSTVTCGCHRVLTNGPAIALNCFHVSGGQSEAFCESRGQDTASC